MANAIKAPVVVLLSVVLSTMKELLQKRMVYQMAVSSSYMLKFRDGETISFLGRLLAPHATVRWLVLHIG